MIIKRNNYKIELKKAAANYIERHISEINDNDWYPFFDGLGGTDTFCMLKVLDNSGIFPLNKMPYLPDFFFCYCKIMHFIKIPGNIKTIGEYCFQKNINLETIVLREGVENIGTLAFNGCRKLHTIYLPKSIKSIGNYAFAGVNSLTIRYKGTMAEWLQINGCELDSYYGMRKKPIIRCKDGILPHSN